MNTLNRNDSTPPVDRLGRAGRRLLLAAVLAVPAAAAGGTDRVADAEACETALALSALPARLRPDATAYLWNGNEFEAAGSTEATFHCLVARNHADAVIPQCFSKSGVDSILEAEMFKSSLVLNGMSTADSVARFEEGAAEGDFVAPSAPGINYMMSAYNWIYQDSRDAFIPVPPHVMFFAPHVTPEAVGGASFQEAVAAKGVPMVVESGIHAYMVTFTNGASEVDDVMAACGGDPLRDRRRAAR